MPFLSFAWNCTRVRSIAGGWHTNVPSRHDSLHYCKIGAYFISLILFFNFNLLIRFSEEVERLSRECRMRVYPKKSSFVLFINLLFCFSEEVERLSRECRMRVYRTSVKEDINVGNVFQHLAENYVNQVKISIYLVALVKSNYLAENEYKKQIHLAENYVYQVRSKKFCQSGKKQIISFGQGYAVPYHMF